MGYRLVALTTAGLIASVACHLMLEGQPEVHAVDFDGVGRLEGRQTQGTLTGYDRRSQFGGWADLDHDGCNTRQEILRRDLALVELRRNCVVLKGILADPYTGQQVHYSIRHASEIPIEHVVSVADAYRSGAKSWTQKQRITFANDPSNLLATTDTANQAKGDSTADEWLPPNAAFRCTYVTTQITIKTKYHLTVTSAEKAALAQAITECDQPIDEK